MKEFTEGNLEVICGPMFSGKSEELIRRMKRVEISGKNFLIIKPALDDRYDKEHIVSHDKRMLKAHVIGNDKNSLKEVEEYINKSQEFIEVLGIEEANFFDHYIIELSEKWVKEGRRVIVGGLDTDFLGRPFGPMPQLLAIADDVDKLKAICMKCKNRLATKTQRLVNGNPAPRDAPTILVGASDFYEPRCLKCHEF